MEKILIYDLPTRIFHWLFALLFIVAFSIGNTVADDSAVFSYHMIAGMTLCFIVILRLTWGIVGTRHARISGFTLRPRELLSYFAGIMKGEKRKWAGHNPASSWAAITMMVFALGLGITGYLMASGQEGESIEEAHELLANGFLIVVLLHITGVVLHSLRHRDAIWQSMFDGRKTDVPGENVLVRPYKAVAILFLLVTAGFSAYLAQSFDSKSRDLAVFGLRLHLGEAEDDKHEHKSGRDGDDSRSTHVGHEID